MKIKKISNGFPKCEDCGYWKLRIYDEVTIICSNCEARYEIVDWEDLKDE